MTAFTLQVFPDAPALADHVAGWLLDLVQASSGRFAICLSGGRTPEALYRRLADDDWRSQFPWERLHWFFGDERFVPQDSRRSNFNMVRQALLDRAPVPPENVHAITTTGIAAQTSAEDYARQLQEFYGSAQLLAGRPLFDVNFLGLGTDGHTASLFPGDSALAEQQKWACEVAGMQPETRITLTYPVLESARHAAFLVTGTEKAAALQQLRQQDQDIPAGRLQPQGSCTIFADEAAAGAGADTQS